MFGSIRSVVSNSAQLKVMTEPQNRSTKLQNEQVMLSNAEARGGAARFTAYIRLSGPGWLQSAITLGGGSLSTSLFLGVLGGVSLLWIQPVAMVLGIIMLSAISYVVLSTGKSPFLLIRQHVNPVIAWGWILATILANIIWALPTFSLGTTAVTSNLLPGSNPIWVSVGILILAVTIIWFYDSGSRGIQIFESVLKAIVALIVLSFVGVVVKLGAMPGGLDWGAILGGFVPDFNQLTTPAGTFSSSLALLTEGGREFWSKTIVDQQRSVIFSGVTYAVGINMTFLLPYSQLAKGWGKPFRGLAVFDLWTSLLIPFVIATSCVVIAASSQFHAIPESGLMTQLNSDGEVELIDAEGPNLNLKSAYDRLVDERLASQGMDLSSMNVSEREVARAELAFEEKQLAAMLVKRGAFTLSSSLEPLMGKAYANYVFGFGVFAMTFSTIIILMLINGFAFCEVLGLPHKGMWHRIGCLLPSIGVLGPVIWKEASFWVVIPTATIGLVALPLAYLSFFCLFNNRSVLGAERIEGGRRYLFNGAMLSAIVFVTFGCLWATYDKAGKAGIVGIGIFVIVAVIVHFKRTSATMKEE